MWHDTPRRERSSRDIYIDRNPEPVRRYAVRSGPCRHVQGQDETHHDEVARSRKRPMSPMFQAKDETHHDKVAVRESSHHRPCLCLNLGVIDRHHRYTKEQSVTAFHNGEPRQGTGRGA